MIQLRADGSVLTRKNDLTDGTEKLATAELFFVVVFNGRSLPDFLKLDSLWI